MKLTDLPLSVRAWLHVTTAHTFEVPYYVATDNTRFAASRPEHAIYRSSTVVNGDASHWATLYDIHNTTLYQPIRDYYKANGAEVPEDVETAWYAWHIHEMAREAITRAIDGAMRDAWFESKVTNRVALCDIAIRTIETLNKESA